MTSTVRERGRDLILSSGEYPPCAAEPDYSRYRFLVSIVGAYADKNAVVVILRDRDEQCKSIFVDKFANM